VQDVAGVVLLRVEDAAAAAPAVRVGPAQLADVAHLPSRLGVEDGAVSDDDTRFASPDRSRPLSCVQLFVAPFRALRERHDAQDPDPFDGELLFSRTRAFDVADEKGRRLALEILRK
jgi:hypothetical protein